MAHSQGVGVVGRRAVVADALVALGFLLLLSWLELNTPAFTDFETEAEPAVQALLRGELRAAIDLMPVYGASLVFEAPVAGIAKFFGGGDVAVYRALAVPGALGLVAAAVVAAGWQRRHGRPRRVQLATVALIAAAPTVALAWFYGHHEEPLVAALAIAGVVAASRQSLRGWVAGGLLVGAAAAAKPSAVLAIPVAMALTFGLRGALIVGASATASGMALIGPLLVLRADAMQAAAVGGGGGWIFKPGNLFWFFGADNPHHLPPPHTGPLTKYERMAPELLSSHAHELIVVLGAALAGIWWWRHRGAAARVAGRRGDVELLASALLLLAAAVWWRALIDPWFQAYYLTPGLLALAMAEAARGRAPVATAIASAGLWLTWGEHAPVAGLSQDALSAVSLAWMLPFGLWLTWAALRRTVTPAGSQIEPAR